jgi:sialic acid synthase SpsE
MYDELKAVDTGKHEVIVKWQLFEKAGDNKPLLPECFEYAYEYGTKLGYKVTASVFDLNSLAFLLEFDVPFVKIANRRDLDWLSVDAARRGVCVCVSYGTPGELKDMPIGTSYYTAQNSTLLDRGIFPRFHAFDEMKLLCVSKYPASTEDYEETFDNLKQYIESGYGISDHTIDWKLYNKYQPDVYEVHFKLSDSTGLDAGPFARTPGQLAEVL